MNATAAAGVGLALIVLALLLIRWKYRSSKVPSPSSPPCTVPVQLVHKLCPHRNVVQRYQVEQKDSLDDHLDVLTRKLAEKEGRLRLSKSKIRETQNEIENLHAIDQDVRVRYREIMESLRGDLLANEKECKKLQEQIEWVSRKRAELRDEVRLGQKLYGEAAAELASNLAEIQKGRSADVKVTDKPLEHSSTSLRRRKEPTLPRASPVSSLAIKTSPRLSHESLAMRHN
ncbi:GRIP1-associated protein 1-like [Danaus plexippus]|uniref:Uncharacterized protein n=1 Tax=Danaus plexippus plexippus TaxID=278856 RepID=A0A212EYJ2_DANPL|nr:GRIP1-associated protein 1-like [Danaus plexippus]OWR46573.1 hypothetical protein KGM_210019 [Danaus plexippus plexippus]